MSLTCTTVIPSCPDPALLPPIPGPSPEPAGSFASKSQENAQIDAKLAPLVETPPLPPATQRESQLAATSIVTSEVPPALVETAANPAGPVLHQPQPAVAEAAGQRQEPQPDEERALIAEGFALLVSQARKGSRGRPTVIDEPMKARIATLMGAGLSMRQAAACLGIDQATISRAVAADRQLKHDVEVARTRATLHPLACILREAGKNWKAAVWLLEHLKTTAYNEKTPLEQAESRAAALVPHALESEIKSGLLAEARAELDARSGTARLKRPRP